MVLCVCVCILISTLYQFCGENLEDFVCKLTLNHFIESSHALRIIGWAKFYIIVLTFHTQNLKIVSVKVVVSIRPIGVYCRAATCVTFVMATVSSMQRIPRAILASMPAAIRIVFFDD